MTDAPKVVLVVAMARETRVIGKDGALPWRIPGDMKHFKEITMGKPCVMGRKTFESLGKPLPGRANIVVTRNAGWAVEGVEVLHSVGEALGRAREIAVHSGAEHVCVIGGAEIYAQAIGDADVIYLTEVEGDVTGDTFLPQFDMSEWEIAARTAFPDDPKATHKATLVQLVRH